jgi:hypothetical protein
MAVDFDVTSLHHRRATHRWERTSVGDLLERMTWSFPDQEALVGREGAYADPAFRRPFPSTTALGGLVFCLHIPHAGR